MLQIVGKTKRFNILLKTRRNLALKSPEAIARKLMCETCVDILHLTEFGKPTLCSTGIRGIVVLERDAVEKKNDFLGQIGDVAARLSGTLISCNAMGSESMHLDETFSPVVVVVDVGSKRLEMCKEGSAVGRGHGERRQGSHVGIRGHRGWWLESSSQPWPSLRNQAVQCVVSSPPLLIQPRTPPAHHRFRPAPSNQKFYGVTTISPSTGRRLIQSPPKAI